MKIGKREVKEIVVTTTEGELLADITDDDIIETDEVQVTCVPYDD